MSLRHHWQEHCYEKKSLEAHAYQLRMMIEKDRAVLHYSTTTSHQCMKYTLLSEITPTEIAKHSWHRKELSVCHLDTKYKCQQPHSREEFSQKRDIAGLPGSRGEGECTLQEQPTETCLFSLARKNKRGNYCSLNVPLAGEQKHQWRKRITRTERLCRHYQLAMNKLPHFYETMALSQMNKWDSGEAF